MVEIRRAEEDDVRALRMLIATVVAETYGHVIDDIAETITSDRLLADSLVAVADEEIVGVGLSVADVVDDPWILPKVRGKGLGARLLGVLECEIADQGHTRGKLRVFAENQAARRFYARHGWQENQQYPHEKLGHMMVECVKDLRPRQ